MPSAMPTPPPPSYTTAGRTTPSGRPRFSRRINFNLETFELMDYFGWVKIVKFLNLILELTDVR